MVSSSTLKSVHSFVKYIILCWSIAGFGYDATTWGMLTVACSSAFRAEVHLQEVLWSPGNSGLAFPHSAQVSRERLLSTMML